MNELASAIDRAFPYSKCGRLRLENTWASLKHVDKHGIPGDFVECGVWRGGSVMVARWASPERRCWLFDTFEGMTAPGPHDIKRNGHRVSDEFNGKSAVTKTEVLSNFVQEGLWEPDKFEIVVGDVCQTLLVSANIPERIAVLRLDTDLYDSTKIEMEVLYPRLQSGGILIVDDYGHWRGARKAVADYLGKKNNLQAIDYTGAWMVKA